MKDSLEVAPLNSTLDGHEVQDEHDDFDHMVRSAFFPTDEVADARMSFVPITAESAKRPRDEENEKGGASNRQYLEYRRLKRQRHV